MTTAQKKMSRDNRYAARERRARLRQPLTIDDLKIRDARAHAAFMVFTEAQTMFWDLSVGPDGDLWAVDYQMGDRVQWIPQIGRWE